MGKAGEKPVTKIPTTQIMQPKTSVGREEDRKKKKGTAYDTRRTRE